MNKFLIVCLAVVSALLVCEGVLHFALRYPATGEIRKFIVQDKLVDDYGVVSWPEPNHKSLTVEGGVSINVSNNYGLPGSDIASGKQNVFVVGNSFIEAGQVEKGKIATSVFQKCLDSLASPFQVINMGKGGADLYINWFRIKFFNGYFKPKHIVYVIESLNRQLKDLKRHKNILDLQTEPNFGKEVTALSGNILSKGVRKIVVNSSLIAILKRAYSESKHTQEFLSEDSGLNNEEQVKLVGAMSELLAAYKAAYPNFMVICLDKDIAQANVIKLICDKHGIFFRQNGSLMCDDNNKINSVGHFNEKGNFTLGLLCNSFFSEYISMSPSESDAIKYASYK